MLYRHKLEQHNIEENKQNLETEQRSMKGLSLTFFSYRISQRTKWICCNFFYSTKLTITIFASITYNSLQTHTKYKFILNTRERLDHSLIRLRYNIRPCLDVVRFSSIHMCSGGLE